MAIAYPGKMVTLPASTTILSTTATSYQFRCVVISTAGEAKLAGIGANIFGVLQNKPTVDGEAAVVMIDGVSKVLAHGSTVSAGQTVSCSTVGMVEASSAGSYTIGRIVAGSSGTTGRVLSMAIEPIGSTA
jgi:hypothetical protein